MNKYSYDLEIIARTEQEADTKVKALSILASNLSGKELEKLANVIQYEPGKTALAKRALGL